ncbi:hypothetical protein GCK72_008644 [Caenorhabditis remanei]|uniref:Uncharacterized protein n=1 Tax=Caenorhabditis remanei TaxID=31234 RepID=A0A6A5H0K2_CAERE|nr:hypothetical protein GCK72_008644 [Caenorhabditis remanei]KAF1760395.1 hypothetical protein GCK72_008644 [Caenorhabditis remanei]
MVDDENDSKFGIFWKGFIACRILPPRDLKLPLLAMKPNGKLLFALCIHSDEEKAFTGTFTTAEIRKALDLGYKITNVYDAVEYESWAKNDASGEGGLFTSYMNKMIALKIYASGWPSDVNTDEEKETFVDDYRKQGIILDNWDLFDESPGRRLSSKLSINSLVSLEFKEMHQCKFSVGESDAIMENVWTFKGTEMVGGAPDQRGSIKKLGEKAPCTLQHTSHPMDNFTSLSIS